MCKFTGNGCFTAKHPEELPLEDVAAVDACDITKVKTATGEPNLNNKKSWLWDEAFQDIFI